MSTALYAEKCIDNSFLPSRDFNGGCNVASSLSSNLRIFSNHRTICDDKTIKIYNQHGDLEFFMYIPTGVQNQIGSEKSHQ